MSERSKRLEKAFDYLTDCLFARVNEKGSSYLSRRGIMELIREKDITFPRDLKLDGIVSSYEGYEGIEVEKIGRRVSGIRIDPDSYSNIPRWSKNEGENAKIQRQ